MDAQQFDVLVKLMRGKPGSAANQAALQGLMDGKNQAEAMRGPGSTRASVNQVVERYVVADRLVRRAYLAPAGGDGV